MLTLFTNFMLECDMFDFEYFFENVYFTDIVGIKTNNHIRLEISDYNKASGMLI